jgi:hypothetical protein
MARIVDRPGLFSAVIPACLLLTCAAIAQEPPPNQTTPPPPPPVSPPKADPTLPHGRALVEGALNAAGGREALDRIESISMYGTAVVPAMRDMTFKVEFHSAANGRFVARQIIEGIGEISDGSNGEVAWRADMATMTYRLIEDDELEQAMGKANIQKILVRALERFDTFDTIEKVNREGAATHRVRLASADHEQYMYFNVDDGLLRSTDVVSEQGVVSLHFDDYESFGDVRLFRTLKVNQGGMMIVMTFDDIVLNKTPDDVFEPPAEVKRLAAEKQAAGQTPPG